MPHFSNKTIFFVSETLSAKVSFNIFQFRGKSLHFNYITLKVYIQTLKSLQIKEICKIISALFEIIFIQTLSNGLFIEPFTQSR